MSLGHSFFAGGTYDFAVSGGAVSVITPPNTEFIPAGAKVVAVYFDETTNVTVDSGGTVTLNCGTVALTGDIAGASVADGKITMASSATLIPITTGANLKVEIKTAAVTAGAFQFRVEYIF